MALLSLPPEILDLILRPWSPRIDDAFSDRDPFAPLQAAPESRRDLGALRLVCRSLFEATDPIWLAGFRLDLRGPAGFHCLGLPSKRRALVRAMDVRTGPSPPVASEAAWRALLTSQAAPDKICDKGHRCVASILSDPKRPAERTPFLLALAFHLLPGLQHVRVPLRKNDAFVQHVEMLGSQDTLRTISVYNDDDTIPRRQIDMSHIAKLYTLSDLACLRLEGFDLGPPRGAQSHRPVTMASLSDRSHNLPLLAPRQSAPQRPVPRALRRVHVMKPSPKGLILCHTGRLDLICKHLYDHGHYRRLAVRSREPLFPLATVLRLRGAKLEIVHLRYCGPTSLHQMMPAEARGWATTLPQCHSLTAPWHLLDPTPPLASQLPLAIKHFGIEVASTVWLAPVQALAAHPTLRTVRIALDPNLSPDDRALFTSMSVSISDRITFTVS